MNREERESKENVLRLSPIVSRAYSLGKEKKFREAYETLQPYLERDEVPSYFCQPAGWTIYRYIREVMSVLLPEQAKTIFGYYFNFCPHQADMLHSCMMMQAVYYKKLHTQEFSFILFCQSWDLNCFRDEDFVETKTTGQNGKQVTYQSLAVRVATLLYKDLKSRHSPELAGVFLPFFDTVLQKCPEYEFTPLYIANLHAWSGDKDTAIDMFKHMLVRGQQWYLWKHLGDLLDDDRRLSCYCKALTMIDEEKYIGEIHLGLATLLAQKGDMEQSAYELEAYTNTYQRNGWRINPLAYEIKNMIGNAEPSHDGRLFYQQHSEVAENLVFGDYPQDDFVFTGIRPNAAGKPRACLSLRRKHLFTRMQVTPLLRKAKKGEIFACRYNAADGHVALLTMHSTGQTENIRHARPDTPATSGKEIIVAGKVKIRPDKPFAFLDKYYISPHLRQAKGLVDGQMIKATAVEQPDGRWKIIRIMST